MALVGNAARRPTPEWPIGSSYGRLGEDGKTPGGAVGPVSGEILPSMRETFYIHHEDESFKHVPFDELVAAYSSDS